ncbi:hypothetical protein IGI04_031343 [Brassica rapa subsp. trilocularis]|uniref:Uncharacterized protein n=1 Tax=Brassica rapa subsp. trilocularis TaxID=1813537 RepID=A0ABQ7LU35_BRACM|nr:hypothetical protein IGI04_031343 [Brassica rapa subsp. trilocularis]
MPTNIRISSESPRYIPRKFRGTWGFKLKTTFYGLNNTYITFIKCHNQIMMFGTMNFGVLSNNKHFLRLHERKPHNIRETLIHFNKR